MIFLHQVGNEDKRRKSGIGRKRGGGEPAYLLGEIVRNLEPSFYYFVENFYRHQLVWKCLKGRLVVMIIELVSYNLVSNFHLNKTGQIKLQQSLVGP